MRPDCAGSLHTAGFLDWQMAQVQLDALLIAFQSYTHSQLQCPAATARLLVQQDSALLRIIVDRIHKDVKTTG